MRNIIFCWLLSLLLVSTSQGTTLTVVLAQDPPPPAKDYFPDKWDEYTSQAGKFRIRFPKQPREAVRTQGQFEVHTLEYKGLLEYRVSYVDYKTLIEDPLKVKGLLEGIKTAALDSLRDKGMRVVTEREVTVDGHPGIFVHVEVQGREIVRLQWVVAGSRLYSIGTSSRKGSPHELEGKDDYEKVASGFINSFHVIP
jgi:hypothetical protein